jgi:hypothetical protein
MKASSVALAFAALVTGVPVFSVLPDLVHATPLPRRPTLTEACNAWREHMGGLIEQHRIAGEIEEKELLQFVRQFIAARNNCAPGRYETGLRMYEAIPLGRPRGNRN